MSIFWSQRPRSVRRAVCWRQAVCLSPLFPLPLRCLHLNALVGSRSPCHARESQPRSSKAGPSDFPWNPKSFFLYSPPEKRREKKTSRNGTTYCSGRGANSHTGNGIENMRILSCAWNSRRSQKLSDCYYPSSYILILEEMSRKKWIISKKSHFFDFWPWSPCDHLPVISVWPKTP